PPSTDAGIVGERPIQCNTPGPPPKTSKQDGRASQTMINDTAYSRASTLDDGVCHRRNRADNGVPSSDHSPPRNRTRRRCTEEGIGQEDHKNSPFILQKAEPQENSWHSF